MHIEKLARIMQHLKLHLTILGSPFIKMNRRCIFESFLSFLKNILLSLLRLVFFKRNFFSHLLETYSQHKKHLIVLAREVNTAL